MKSESSEGVDPITYVNTRINDTKEFIKSMITEIKEAVRIATSSLDKRLDGMNEFRDTLKDQAGRFVTREEMAQIIGRIETDIKNLQLAKASLEGKASEESVQIVASRAQWGMIFGAIGTTIAIVGFISRFL